MGALPGEHYCLEHQGNHSHYAPHNCTVCRLKKELKSAREALHKVLVGSTLSVEELKKVMGDE
jgi:hypothetical protein